MLWGQMYVTGRLKQGLTRWPFKAMLRYCCFTCPLYLNSIGWAVKAAQAASKELPLCIEQRSLWC